MRPVCAPEFRQQMAELVRAGRTPEQLAREFNASAHSITSSVARSARDPGHRHGGPTKPERNDLGPLRRKNRQLKLEQAFSAGSPHLIVPAREGSSNARTRTEE